MEVEKFDLNPQIKVTCPFCGREFVRNLEKVWATEIECSCGAIVEFACDFEWGCATLNKKGE